MLESRALRGAVAQLGERRVRNAKVEGSIPFRSTIPCSSTIPAVRLTAQPETDGAYVRRTEVLAESASAYVGAEAGRYSACAGCQDPTS
jgi:hypothetical protein